MMGLSSRVDIVTHQSTYEACGGGAYPPVHIRVDIRVDICYLLISIIKNQEYLLRIPSDVWHVDGMLTHQSTYELTKVT